MLELQKRSASVWLCSLQLLQMHVAMAVFLVIRSDGFCALTLCGILDHMVKFSVTGRVFGLCTWLQIQSLLNLILHQALKQQHQLCTSGQCRPHANLSGWNKGLHFRLVSCSWYAMKIWLLNIKRRSGLGGLWSSTCRNRIECLYCDYTVVQWDTE